MSDKAYDPIGVRAEGSEDFTTLEERAKGRGRFRKSFLALIILSLLLRALRTVVEGLPENVIFWIRILSYTSVPLLIVGTMLLICSCSDVKSVRRVAAFAAFLCGMYYVLNVTEEIEFFRYVPFLGEEGFFHNGILSLAEVGTIAALCVSFYLAVYAADVARSRLALERRDLALEVAERQRTEAALRDSEQRFRLIFDNIQEGIVSYGGNVKPMFFNHAAANMVGYTPEELLSLDSRVMVHPEDWDMVQAYNQKRMRGEPVERTYLLRLVHRDGHVIYVEASFDPVLRDGEVIGIQGIYRDVTERKRAEEALRESEEHYRQLFEGINDGVYVINADYRIIAANERAEQLLGYAHEEMMGMRYGEICGPEDEMLAPGRLESVVAESESRWESTRRRRDGSAFPVDVSARRIQYHGQPAIMLISRDITESKRMEEALEALAQGVSTDQSGEIFQRLVANLAKALDLEFTAVAVMDEPGSKEVRTIACFVEGEYIENRTYSIEGTPCEAVLHNGIYLRPSGVLAAFPDHPLLREFEAESYVGAPLLSSSGKLLGILVGAGKKPLANLRDAESMIRIFAGRAVSELERQRVLEALRMSEERLRTLFEGIDDALFVYDENGVILDCNAAACRRLGYTRQDLLTLRMHNVDAPWFYEQFPARIAQQMKQGRMACEGEHIAADGRHIPVDIHTSRISYQGRTAILAVARDITERKRSEEERRRLEAQMQHAQKLEGLGVLAGGIAHEFNNLLMGVLGNASLALMELPPDSSACESLRQIEMAAQRAAELSKQMLAYSGKGRFVIQPLNLSEVVGEMAHLLDASASKNAEVQFELSPETPLMEGDLSQVRQVIVNLVSNASEALNDRTGTITVATGIMQATRESLKDMYLCENLPEGRYAYVEVRDTGCGMDSVTIGKVFDPFFSTKFTGRGLGLAAVMGIVRGHKGAIRVQSAKGEGSTFTVLFPYLQESVRPEPLLARPGGEWRGSGTVLLVDDEETVRMVTRRVLELAGFSVLLACDGVEGVEMFKEHAPNLSAVLLDMTMPRMSGEEALRQMRGIRAEVPIVLSSGYNEPDALEHFSSDGPSGFIQKPYRAEELITKMHSVLASCRTTKA
ncbi:MAG: PAS domain S-box protein [FCB group bacterium]|jgi:PAS domain S-box-containing protein|nr:PAS domain S-box protein [FCB group bacterium]